MKHFFRSPITWICGAGLSLLLCLTAFHFFPKAFPLVSVDITMNLAQALQKAKECAKANNCGPDTYHSAAQFSTDTMTTTFVELEGGGKDVLDMMIAQEFYMPYTWQVRHFKEHETNETTIAFTPQGRPYGFAERISENLTGVQLNEKEAQSIAQTHAQELWNIDFTPYTLVEASQKKEPSGRIDHTFVYERMDIQLNEGRYRLLIGVSGDKVTQLSHFVKIPESFSRRYDHMRSANNTIAWITSVLAFLLFGGIVGCFFSLKKQWFFLRTPLMWGIFLGSTTVLSQINNLPFLWMFYSTSSSIMSFLSQQCIGWIITFFSTTCITTGALVAAETLSNRAFKNHPQVWQLWSSSAAASYQVAGRTLGGYLVTSFNIAFVVLFYVCSRIFLGWWNPSGPLFDPNILATYAPWFSPVANALNAAFIEEALFRAIPLAGAALIGQRLGKRNLCLIIGLIVQAIIFGAAHANYPAQPAYARVVELFIPALIWGITYLRFGLLPVVITHFVYDVVWMSLPLFISHAPYTLLYKCLVILLTFIPLLIVVYARIKRGSWTELSATDYNSALVEPEIKTTTTAQLQQLPTAAPLTKTCTYTLIIIGAASLITFLYLKPWVKDGVYIQDTRATATQRANEYLARTTITLAEPWRTLPLVFTHYSAIPSISAQHRFIWNEGGKDAYHSFLGTYLEPTHWTVRYAQFEGDIVQRAEEYYVILNNTSITRFYHKLPESAAGESLTKDQARPLAHAGLMNRFALDATTLEEVSAEEIKKPNRKDWLFTFSDPTYPLTKGKAYVRVLISGNEVVDAGRSIHVPEEWTREDERTQQTAGILYIVCLIALIFFCIGSFAYARQPLTMQLSKRTLLLLFLVLFTLSTINAFNLWSTIIGSFTTSQPLSEQIMRFFASQLVSMLITTGFLAYYIMYTTARARMHSSTSCAITYMLGACTGLFFVTTAAILSKLFPSHMPSWANYTPLEASSPMLAVTIQTIFLYLKNTSIALFFVSILNGLQLRGVPLYVILGGCILFGLAMTNMHPAHTLGIWLLIGTMVGILFFIIYVCVIRANPGIIVSGMIPIITLTQLSAPSYSGADIQIIIATMLMMIIAANWLTMINPTRVLHE